MTDSIMAIAVAVLVPLCGYLGFQWWQAANRCKRIERNLGHSEWLYGQSVQKNHTFATHNRQLWAALGYYADKSNWQSEAGKHSAAYRDKGQIARKALQGES